MPKHLVLAASNDLTKLVELAGKLTGYTPESTEKDPWLITPAEFANMFRTIGTRSPDTARTELRERIEQGGGYEWSNWVFYVGHSWSGASYLRIGHHNEDKLNLTDRNVTGTEFVDALAAVLANKIDGECHMVLFGCWFGATGSQKSPYMTADSFVPCVLSAWKSRYPSFPLNVWATKFQTWYGKQLSVTGFHPRIGLGGKSIDVKNQAAYEAYLDKAGFGGENDVRTLTYQSARKKAHPYAQGIAQIDKNYPKINQARKDALDALKQRMVEQRLIAYERGRPKEQPVMKHVFTHFYHKDGFVCRKKWMNGAELEERICRLP